MTSNSSFLIEYIESDSKCPLDDILSDEDFLEMIKAKNQTLLQ